MSERFALASNFFKVPEWRKDISLRETIVSSAGSIRSTKTIVLLGVLVAAQIVLGMVTTIPIGQFVRISFDFLALAAMGMLLGPVPAAAGGAVVDVLKYFMRGGADGPYFIGFTVTVALSGLIYGIVFYKRDLNIYRMVIGKLAVSLLANLLLNSLNLQLMYGNVTFVILTTRAIKNLFMLPVDVLLLSLTLPVLKYAHDQIARRS